MLARSSRSLTTRYNNTSLVSRCLGTATSQSLSPTGRGTSFHLPDPTNFMTYKDNMTYPKSLLSSEYDSCPLQTWTPQLTKIVSTIGPTSEQFDVMQDLVRCGVRIMRLNFSHATVEEVELRVKNLRMCQGRHGAFSSSDNGEDDKNVRGILLDTRGPEIRMGKLQNDHSGHETIKLEAGNSITLHMDDHWAGSGSTKTDLFIDYPKLHKVLAPGSKVLLDDGAIILTVTTVHDNDDDNTSSSEPSHITCTIDNTGELRSRAGVNLPGAETDLPAMSQKDRIDILYGMTKDVDYIAPSFVQSAQHVREIREYVQQCANELNIEVIPLIISKIESMSALKHFDEILKESDGIMVARGDLGVEIPIQQVTNAQKEMVAACNRAGKPVIVATQMLESMAKNPRPTRAEVSDVTNAVYDGADAVMTSGETAKGKYPVETVKMMNEIILSAEKFREVRPDLVGTGHGLFEFGNEIENDDDKSLSDRASVAKAAVTAASNRHAKAILVLAGTRCVLPRLVSAYRPDVPIVVFSPTAKMARQLMIYRGVHPVAGKLRDVPMQQRPTMAIKYAKEMGFIQKGDDVVVVGMETDIEMEEFATMRVTVVK